MRSTAFAVAALWLAAVISGCPAQDGGEEAGTATVQPAAAGGESADTTAPAAGSRRKITSSLAIDGMQLGSSVEDVLARYPADGALKPQPVWAVEDATGIVPADLADGSTAEQETSYFLGGQLVGFVRHVEQDAALFALDTEALREAEGPSASDPPAWALATSFFEGYEDAPKEDYVDFMFWADEQSHVVLVAMYNNEFGAADYMLLHTELFDQCVDATIEASSASAPPPPPPPDEIMAEPPSEPGLAGDYRVDGIKLGISFEQLSQRYPADGGMLVSETWAEDGQTGMLGANPIDGTPMPAESAVFLYERLVGFTVVDTMDEATFLLTTAEELTESYGESTADPPQWCLETSFFAQGYPPRPEHMLGMFWADEDSRTMLMAVYNAEQEALTLMVADLDRYQPAYEAAMAAAMQQMMTDLGGEDGGVVQVPY